jgi:rhamnosyl/mannosyltransferase
LDSVDHIITTSPNLRDRSERLHQHRDKTTVIPPSVDLEKIDTQVETSEIDIPDSEVPTVLFTGRLNYYKGVSYLLEAISTMETSVELLVVGDGGRRKELERHVDFLGISNSVHFLGYVSDERLNACYESASVFVLPSVEPSEAFGIVQLEAMAHGLPVINTNLPTGVPWVSLDGETGITVPPRDSSALAEALDSILSDPEQKAAYGQAARKRVEDQFTEAEMISDTIEVYRAVTTE